MICVGREREKGERERKERARLSREREREPHGETRNGATASREVQSTHIPSLPLPFLSFHLYKSFQFKCWLLGRRSHAVHRVLRAHSRPSSIPPVSKLLLSTTASPPPLSLSSSRPAADTNPNLVSHMRSKDMLSRYVQEFVFQRGWVFFFSLSLIGESGNRAQINGLP